MMIITSTSLKQMQIKYATLNMWSLNDFNFNFNLKSRFETKWLATDPVMLMVLQIHAVLLVWQSRSPIRSGLRRLRIRRPKTNARNPEKSLQSRCRKMASAEPETTLCNLVVKKSSTQVIREDFRFETTNVQQKKVIVCYCVSSVTEQSMPQTHQHLKNTKQLFDKCMDKKSSSEARVQCDKLRFQGPMRHRVVMNAITHNLAKDRLSIKTVNKDGFQKLLWTLDNRCAIPSHTSCSQNCMSAECRKKV